MSEAINNQLKEAVTNNNVIIGSKRIIKSLKTSEIDSIVIATNCPENVKKDINHSSELAGVKEESKQ